MRLKRAAIVTGALALLDTDGLDGLTMRKLGARLGVQAGGIYWHFTNKEALLGAMADRIVGQITSSSTAYTCAFRRPRDDFSAGLRRRVSVRPGSTR
ncbi:TetR family transcriptional regulator [Actinomadura sp. DC4]|uniref:TetR family transcriptional regulator n=1 Tax=Actinomadura sp. DC4 TaxID=3055069 RepID=UPI0025B16A9A|nr:TetR family transcriptional regulator [Actinomadura sp. DC4]MDN3352097.1 TetR family transcriptional regulator [Actinomadura sp. DC4]